MYQFPASATCVASSPQYLESSLSPRPGFLLNIPTIMLTLRGKPNGPDSFDLRASLDNFERTNPTAGVSDVNLNTCMGTSTVKGTTMTATLPAAFVNTTTTITFRLYGYNASNTGGFAGDKPGGVFQNPDGSNFSISGTAPMRLAALNDQATTPLNTPVTFTATANDGPSVSVRALPQPSHVHHHRPDLPARRHLPGHRAGPHRPPCPQLATRCLGAPGRPARPPPGCLLGADCRHHQRPVAAPHAAPTQGVDPSFSELINGVCSSGKAPLISSV